MQGEIALEEGFNGVVMEEEGEVVLPQNVDEVYEEGIFELQEEGVIEAQNGNVQEDRMQDGNVQEDKMQDGNVQENKAQNGNVQEDKVQEDNYIIICTWFRNFDCCEFIWYVVIISYIISTIGIYAVDFYLMSKYHSSYALILYIIVVLNFIILIILVIMKIYLNTIKWNRYSRNIILPEWILYLRIINFATRIIIMIVGLIMFILFSASKEPNIVKAFGILTTLINSFVVYMADAIFADKVFGDNGDYSLCNMFCPP